MDLNSYLIFTLQIAYSTLVPTGGKKSGGFFYITVFNVSLIFTAVLVAAARNCSACHVLLSRDKGSSTLLLGSETSRDKGSWVSGLPPLVFCINLAKCFSTCTSELKKLLAFCGFGKSKQSHHLVLQGCDAEGLKGIPSEQPWLLWLCLSRPRNFGVSGFCGTSTPSGACSRGTCAWCHLCASTHIH